MYRPFIIACLVCTGAHAIAQRPAQFRVWGTAGPVLPPPPAGWTLLREPPVAMSPTADETARGFVLLRWPLFPAGPVSPARLGEAGLTATAAQGQYVPLTFGLLAQQPVQGVKVSVGPIERAAGVAIPADHVDVRFVRAVREVVSSEAKTYRLVPFLLEKRESIDLAPGEVAQVWLTIKAPESAKAGLYRGTVTAQAPDGARASIPISVKVLPFGLPPAPVEMALFYPNPPADDALLEKELIDQREHGMNAVEPFMAVQIKTRDRVFGPDDEAATLAECRRMLAAEQRVFGRSPFAPSFEVGHQIAYFWDQSINWFRFWPHSPAIDADFVKAARVVVRAAKEAGYESLRAQAMDEAGAHGYLDEAIYYYGLLKWKVPEVRTWTDIGGGIAMGHDEIGRLRDVVDIFNTNRFTPEIARELVNRKKPFGIYNGAGPTPAGVRYFYGFYGYKSAATEIAQWCYTAGESVFRGTGLRNPDEGYVYHAADGPLPSIYTEAARAGVDDYRYLDMLARMGAPTSGPYALAGAGLYQAYKVREPMRKSLARVSWDFMSISAGDRLPPPDSSQLDAWRAEISSAIGSLFSAGSFPTTSPQAITEPRSPFDLPWAPRPMERFSYGPEMLPITSFAGGMKPFRAEAWNGKGTGTLDAAVCARGPSLRAAGGAGGCAR